MKVAFLGPKGTYTHQAASEYFESFEPVPCDSVEDAVESDADAAVIPFENSLGGSVGESVDLLRDKDLTVTGEQNVEISHVLASRSETIEDIEKVVSHPQALTQCRKKIKEHGWDEKESSSTASAAMSLDDGEAAICSAKAAEINGLNILSENVQDKSSNTTRFLIIGGKEQKGDKTSLILEPGKDRPGLLANMLSCFSGHSVNLAYIQSRPTRDGLGNYYFYIEAEQDKGSEEFENAVKCVETYSEVKVLGSFKGDKK